MRIRGLPFVVAALAGVWLTNAAHAQQSPPPMGNTVDILGCVNRGVESCLIIKDNKSGKTYQINAANPPPPQGPVVHLTGTIVTLVDFCQQGPVLYNIKWSLTPLRCPVSETK
jgi:hypothetical protein